MRISNNKKTAPAKKGSLKSREPKPAAGAALAEEMNQWCLRLYVAGQTPKSIADLANLKAFCMEHLDGEYEVEVIDLVKDPGRARADQIVAIPTLVRRLPAPVKKIIGDLSQKERVLVGFDFQPKGGNSGQKING